MESIVESGEISFHPHHCLLLIVKWLLINLYGRKPGYLNHQLSRERLVAKVRYCQQYLKVLDVIDAGISHNRGEHYFCPLMACTRTMNYKGARCIGQWALPMPLSSSGSAREKKCKINHRSLNM